MRWAESYRHKQFCKESAKMWHEPFSYILLPLHQTCEHWHGVHQPGLGSIPQCQICSPDVAPEDSSSTTVTGHYCSISYLICKLHSLAGSCSIAGIAAFSQLIPCYRQTFLPSMPDHSFSTNYHWCTVAIWISPSITALQRDLWSIIGLSKCQLRSSSGQKLNRTLRTTWKSLENKAETSLCHCICLGCISSLQFSSPSIWKGLWENGKR